jgi:carbonic anhydrase
MQKILYGLNRFQREVFPHQKKLFESLVGGQEPRALFITCGDSRIVPTLFTQTQPGELFICRQVGNIVPPHGTVYGGVSSTVEYAVGVLGVKHVILCGHTDCGAMRAVLNPEKLDKLPNVRKWLDNAEVARQIVNMRCPDGPEDLRLRMVTEENVRVQLRHLETHPSVAVAVAKGELSLHGWVYHIENGDVDAYDPHTDKFVRITFNDPGMNTAEMTTAKISLDEEGKTVVTHG